MSQTEDIVGALKNALRDSGFSYATLAPRLGLSESAVKRMFAKSSLSLKRLEEICEAADISVADLILRSEESRRDIDELTEAQEQTLVSDPRLLLVAFLLLNFRTVEWILTTYEITELEMVQLLAQLDRLKIIHLLAGNQVRMRLSRTFSWRRNGPIQKLFERQIQSEFFRSHFNGPGELRLVLNGMISNASLEQLHQRMQRVAAEFEDLVREDRTTLGPDPLLNTMVLAVRPWTMQMFQALRKKGGAKVN